jgi:hypothetical protein
MDEVEESNVLGNKRESTGIVSVEESVDTADSEDGSEYEEVSDDDDDDSSSVPPPPPPPLPPPQSTDHESVEEEIVEELDEEELIGYASEHAAEDEVVEEAIDDASEKTAEEDVLEEVIEDGKDEEEEVLEEEVVDDDASEKSAESEYADQVVDSWQSMRDEEPDDYEAAVSALIAVVYKDEPVDIESMKRRTPLPELYRYLKQQYWYKIHTDQEEAAEAAETLHERQSEIVSVDDMLKGRLEGLISKSASTQGADKSTASAPPAKFVSPSARADEKDSVEQDVVDEEVIEEEVLDAHPDEEVVHEVVDTHPDEEVVHEVVDAHPDEEVTEEIVDAHPDEEVTEEAVVVDGKPSVELVEEVIIEGKSGYEYVTDEEEVIEEEEVVIEEKSGDEYASEEEEVVSDDDSSEYADQVIESWQSVVDEEPEDYEAAVSALIAIIYKDEEIDLESMLRRTPIKELYKYFKRQYWYKIHTDKEEANVAASTIQEKPSEIVSVDDMLKSRLQGLIVNAQESSTRNLMGDQSDLTVSTRSHQNNERLGDVESRHSRMQNMIGTVKLSRRNVLDISENNRAFQKQSHAVLGVEEEDDSEEDLFLPAKSVGNGVGAKNLKQSKEVVVGGHEDAEEVVIEDDEEVEEVVEDEEEVVEEVQSDSDVEEVVEGDWDVEEEEFISDDAGADKVSSLTQGVRGLTVTADESDAVFEC